MALILRLIGALVLVLAGAGIGETTPRSAISALKGRQARRDALAAEMAASPAPIMTTPPIRRFGSRAASWRRRPPNCSKR